MSANSRDHDQGHNHEWNHVHDRSMHDTREFTYEGTEKFDARMIFIIMPTFLLFVIAWLMFDWRACIAFHFNHVAAPIKDYHKRFSLRSEVPITSV